MTNAESQTGYLLWRLNQSYLRTLLAHAAPMLAAGQSAMLVVGNENRAALARLLLARGGYENIHVRVAATVQPRRRQLLQPKSRYHA